jgi:hypothetical protein
MLHYPNWPKEKTKFPPQNIIMNMLRVLLLAHKSKNEKGAQILLRM